YTAREGRALINYGVTAGHPGARRALVLHDQSLTGAAAVSDTTRSWTYGTLPPADLPRLDTLIEEGMADGALGIGLGIEYTPGARAHGVDVTTEAYPYTAASTSIQSAVFDRGWQDRMGIGYHDILYPPTGERLTRASFQRLRRTGAVVVFFFIPDSIVRLALGDSLVMVASDGISPHGHPRLAGTHARVLGRYARHSSVLSLMDAVRKL